MKNTERSVNSPASVIDDAVQEYDRQLKEAQEFINQQNSNLQFYDAIYSDSFKKKHPGLLYSYRNGILPEFLATLRPEEFEQIKQEILAYP